MFLDVLRWHGHVEAPHDIAAEHEAHNGRRSRRLHTRNLVTHISVSHWVDSMSWIFIKHLVCEQSVTAHHHHLLDQTHHARLHNNVLQVRRMALEYLAVSGQDVQHRVRSMSQRQRVHDVSPHGVVRVSLWDAPDCELFFCDTITSRACKRHLRLDPNLKASTFLFVPGAARSPSSTTVAKSSNISCLASTTL